MKKLLSLFLLVSILVLSLGSCFEVDNTAVKIGVMNGPTGMGMAKLINDNKSSEEKYVFSSYASPDLAIPALTKGELDMLCLPTNTAATLSKKLDISIIAINCLGSLYLLTDGENEVNSISDLEGKTIYTSVPNSTTGPIVNYLLDTAGVSATVETVADHDSLVALVASGDAPIVVLPEPKASAALTKNSDYSVDLNLSTVWSELSDEPLTMGCIVARNEFLNEHKSVVDRFLAEYKASIEYINTSENKAEAVNMIVDAGIIPAAGLANKALANLYGSLVYLDGNDMKSALVSFYNAIGQALPDEKLYYISK